LQTLTTPEVTMWTCAAVIALVAVAGCNGGAHPEATARQPSTTVTSTASPLEVTVSAEPARVPAGGRLRIVVTVRNRSTAPITLEFTSGCQTDYEFVDASGATVASSGQMCTQAMGSRTLAAGESFSDTHVWIRGLAGMPQVPGTELRVRGVLLASGGELRSEKTARVERP
jgi:hypothetical protein